MTGDLRPGVTYADWSELGGLTVGDLRSAARSLVDVDGKTTSPIPVERLSELLEYASDLIEWALDAL